MTASSAQEGMRIAWVSPLHSRSAIARFSRTVALALSATGATVDLWGRAEAETVDAPGVRVRELDPRTWAAEAADYDWVIYNFGNNVPYHEAVYEAYLRWPGVVVMHDRYMLGFFYYRCLPHATEPTLPGMMRLMSLMTHFYGEDGRRAGLRLIDQEAGAYDEMVEEGRFTLLEACMSNAIGLVTHSRTALEAMAPLAPAGMSSTNLSLPFVDEPALRGFVPLTRAELGLPEDRWILVSSGQLQPSKRVEVMLDAIVGSPVLRDRVLLVAAGDDRYAGEYTEMLRRRARDAGAPECLRITGALDDREYYSLLAVADGTAALRSGRHETASATLAEQLYFGKAVIVSPSGVFGETPDDVVMKLDPVDEVGSARVLLEALVREPEVAQRYGRAARQYASTVLAAESYARGLLAYLATLAPAKDRAYELQRVADQLVRRRADSFRRTLDDYERADS